MVVEETMKQQNDFLTMGHMGENVRAGEKQQPLNIVFFFIIIILL